MCGSNGGCIVRCCMVVVNAVKVVVSTSQFSMQDHIFRDTLHHPYISVLFMEFNLHICQIQSS